jgi:hypothetical protein
LHHLFFAVMLKFEEETLCKNYYPVGSATQI